jgi:hypothetical protein
VYFDSKLTEADRLSLGARETAKIFRFEEFMKPFKKAIGLDVI